MRVSQRREKTGSQVEGGDGLPGGGEEGLEVRDEDNSRLKSDSAKNPTIMKTLTGDLQPQLLHQLEVNKGHVWSLDVWRLQDKALQCTTVSGMDCNVRYLTDCLSVCLYNCLTDCLI